MLSEVIDTVRKCGNPIVINDKNFIELIGYGFKIDLNELSHTNGQFSIEQIVEAQNVLYSIPSKRYPEEYSRAWYAGLNKIKYLLNHDINNRQSIIHFYSLFDTGRPDPCLSSVQFLVRNNKLEMVVMMRSWHLQEYAMYDLQLFYKMAKRVSEHVNIELGNLLVCVGSMHIDG